MPCQQTRWCLWYNLVRQIDNTLTRFWQMLHLAQEGEPSLIGEPMVASLVMTHVLFYSTCKPSMSPVLTSMNWTSWTYSGRYCESNFSMAGLSSLSCSNTLTMRKDEPSTALASSNTTRMWSTIDPWNVVADNVSPWKMASSSLGTSSMDYHTYAWLQIPSRNSTNFHTWFLLPPVQNGIQRLSIIACPHKTIGTIQLNSSKTASSRHLLMNLATILVENPRLKPKHFCLSQKMIKKSLMRMTNKKAMANQQRNVILRSLSYRTEHQCIVHL